MDTYTLTPEKKTREEKGFAEERVLGNLMNDKRIHRGVIHNMHNLRQGLSPQEQEQMYMDKEKEKKEMEMIRRQIEVFKRARQGKTPYDIRPAPLPRIPVDLRYFLTANTPMPKASRSTPTQTEKFIRRPVTPLYVPKKRGINNSTQVWDGELFCFEDESFPIVNVLTFKTIEESLQEVEEESEIERFNAIKKLSKENKDQRDDEDQQELNLELSLISDKKRQLQISKDKIGKAVGFIKKAQNVNMSKEYISLITSKAIARLIEDNRIIDMHKHTVTAFCNNMIQQKAAFHNSRKEALTNESVSMTESIIKDIVQRRRQKIDDYKRQASKNATKEINFSDTKRLVRFSYINEEYKPLSEFKRRLGYKINEKEYSVPEEDSQLIDNENDEEEEKQSSKGESVVPETPREVFNPPEYRSIMIDNLKVLSFAVANHPYLDIPKELRKFSIYIEAYSSNERLVLSSIEGIKHIPNSRNVSRKFSDDEKYIIDLRKMPLEVEHILIYIKENPEAPECQYARYYLDDYSTSQHIDYQSLNQKESILCYRIHRQEENPRRLKVVIEDEETKILDFEDKNNSSWLLDFYSIPLGTKLTETSDMILGIVQDSSEYLQSLKNRLIEYRTKKTIEFGEFEKRKSVLESAAEKKGKKGRVRLPPPPKKIIEYIEPTYQPPSRTFGPYHIDLNNDHIEELRTEIKNEIEDQEISLFIKTKELRNTNRVIRAHTVFDLKIVHNVIQEEDSVVEEAPQDSS